MLTRRRLARMGVTTVLAGALVAPVAARVVAEPARPAEVTVWVNAFIPSTVAGSRAVPAGPHAGTTVFRGPFGGSCFATDQRSFSSDADASARLHAEVRIEVGSSRVTPRPATSTPTIEVDCDRGTELCVRTAVPTGGFIGARSTATTAMLDLAAAARNPCVAGAPNVDVNGRLELVRTGQDVRVSFSGNVEAFPSFEMYARVDGGPPQPLFRRSVSGGVLSLLGPATTPVEGSVRFSL